MDCHCRIHLTSGLPEIHGSKLFSHCPCHQKATYPGLYVFTNFDSPGGLKKALSSTEIKTETKQVVPQLAWTPAASEDEIGGRLVTHSVEHLQSYLGNTRQTLNRTMLFGTVSGNTVGITGIADIKAALMQVCKDRSGNDIFGHIAASNDGFSTVYDMVGPFSNDSCVDTSSYAETRDLVATLPDVRLQQNASASCFANQIKQEDFYNRVATAYGLS
ncbi:hypothetical protein EsH8_X_000754 [Colletotrichum jinshuiense]